MTDLKQPTADTTGIASASDASDNDAERAAANNTNVVFQDLDVNHLEVNVVESLCFSCGNNLDVKNKEDLDKYVFTTDYTSVQMQELDFGIPPMSQRSQVTTVEGIIIKTLSNLSDQKVLIDSTNPELSGKIQAVVIDGLILDRWRYPVLMDFEDPTGKIFVSNPCAPHTDPRMVTEKLNRVILKSETCSQRIPELGI